MKEATLPSSRAESKQGRKNEDILFLEESGFDANPIPLQRAESLTPHSLLPYGTLQGKESFSHTLSGSGGSTTMLRTKLARQHRNQDIPSLPSLRSN